MLLETSGRCDVSEEEVNNGGGSVGLGSVASLGCRGLGGSAATLKEL